MISVIVCSIKSELLINLRENVDATVGAPYEFIAVDNKIYNKGICDVYNECVNKAQFPILCFVHEDVIIHSKGWGHSLIKLLSNTSVGLVGISGAVYKSRFPASWSACDDRLYRTYSIQHFNNEVKKVIKINPLEQDCADVAVIDGVFMATTKKIFENCQFDSSLLKGFHCYDLDYSLQVSRFHKLVVTYGILVEHFSEGTLSKKWVDDTIAVHKKWRNELPYSVTPLDEDVMTKSDYISCQAILGALLKETSYKAKILKYYLILIVRYWRFNRLKFTKAVFKKLVESN